MFRRGQVVFPLNSEALSGALTLVEELKELTDERRNYTFENYIITLTPTVLRKRGASESGSHHPCGGGQRVHILPPMTRRAMLSLFGKVHPEPIVHWREGNSPRRYGAHVLYCCLQRQERQSSGGRAATDPAIVCDCARPLQWIPFVRVCSIKTWESYPLKFASNQERLEC